MIKVIDKRYYWDDYYMLGLLYFLIAGRRLSTTLGPDQELELLPQDIAAVSCLVHALLQRVAEYSFNNILYEQIDETCTLIFTVTSSKHD